jgi:predicted nucleic acid-binding protein
MIVLDANILVRAILGRRVRQMLETYAAKGVRFFSPDVAFPGAAKYLPQLLRKRGHSVDNLTKSLEYLRTLVELVTPELYAVLEKEARQRLRGRDANDWPVLAAALALSCGVWTEDADFFGTEIAVWTTSRIEIFLAQRASSIQSRS